MGVARSRGPPALLARVSTGSASMSALSVTFLPGFAPRRRTTTSVPMSGRAISRSRPSSRSRISAEVRSSSRAPRDAVELMAELGRLGQHRPTLVSRSSMPDRTTRSPSGQGEAQLVLRHCRRLPGLRPGLPPRRLSGHPGEPSRCFLPLPIGLVQPLVSSDRVHGGREARALAAHALNASASLRYAPRRSRRGSPLPWLRRPVRS